MTTSWNHLRLGAVLLACGALITIACGGGDTTFEPLPKGSPSQAGIVGGTVLDVGGHRIVDAVVTLETAENGVPATAKWMLDHPDATSDNIPGRRTTLTNQSGRYAFNDVKSGDYILNVQANDHLAGSQTLNVPAEALTDTIIVNVTLTPTGNFTGNAFLEAASTHPNTIVYVQSTSYVAVTGPGGSYTISGVPTGSYTVRAAHSGYLDDTRSGTISTAGQTVTLSDMILKIDLNIAPVAIVTASAQACALDPVALSGAASTDADGTIVSYMWDFEDDGSVDFTSATATASHVYSVGIHHVKLRVIDNNGAVALAVATFNAVGADSLFVSATGSDSNPGTRSLPKQTIGAGITAAVTNPLGSCRSLVIVAGDHTESPVFVPGIDVLGGFNPTTWTRAANSYSIVNVQNTPALASNISSSNTTISGFDFRATNGQSGTPTQRNSVAMRVISSSTLAFVDCRFQSGNGASAPGGTAGLAGANGSPGVTNTGAGGGAGGAAGSPGGFAGGNGSTGTGLGTAGSGGCGGGGGSQGIAGSCSQNASNGGPGGVGCSGTHGANAAAQGSFGVAGTDWTPRAGFAGMTGTGGSGGGGGGGGGAQIPGGNPACMFLAGGGGAGGGGGGAFASSGTGGGGGGASFAVYLYDSSPSFVDCRFTTGAGGVGGAGGNGGSGGSGGLGGIFGSCVCSGWGGNGGAGGAGGHGGAGSGGPGGLSFGLYRAGSSTPVISNPTYNIGSGGQGGAGGVRPDAVSAPAGPNGTTGNVGP